MSLNGILFLALIVVPAVCGLVLFIYGLRLSVSVFRRLPTGTALRNTFLGALFATWGVALMVSFLYIDQPFLGVLFFGLGLVIAGANTLREYIVRSLLESWVESGRITPAQAFPFDASVRGGCGGGEIKRGKIFAEIFRGFSLLGIV